MGLLMFKKIKLMSILFTLLLSVSSMAKLNLDYPELLVVPKASTRISQEVKRKDSKLSFNWAVSASAATTIVASIFQMGNVDLSRDERESSPKVGMAVGAFWLGTNAFLAYRYKGYMNALNDVRGMRVKTKSQRLAKERAAEEYINELGSLAKKIKWMSFASNFAALIDLSNSL